MNTLRRFSAGQFSIPGGTSWYLADLGEFRGKQELYTRQSPQRLKSLRELAIINGPKPVQPKRGTVLKKGKKEGNDQFALRRRK